MRKGFLGSLATLLLAAAAVAQAPAPAQTYVTPPAYSWGTAYPGYYVPVQYVPPVAESSSCTGGCCGQGNGYGSYMPTYDGDYGGPYDGGKSSCDHNGCWPRDPLKDALWIDAEFLLWSIKHGPEPTPILSTGATGVGAVVLGGHELDYPTFSGGKVTAGFWFDPSNQCFGMEGSGFMLQHRSISQGVNSDATGNPTLLVPFFDTSTHSPLAEAIASPGAGAGGATLTSGSQLWGTDINLLAVLYRQEKVRVTLITGGRFLDLEESLNIAFQSQGLAAGFVGIGNTEAAAGSRALITDNVHARTEFYGGQLGGRFEWYFDRFYVNVTGKGALGISRESVEVSGNTMILPVGVFTGPTLISGGIFSSGTNSGVVKDNQFAWLGELDAKVGVQIAYGFSAFIGYDYLQWSKTARPGEQLNRQLDSTRIPFDPNFVNGVTAAAAARPVSDSTFWAHGVNVGLMFRY